MTILFSLCWLGEPWRVERYTKWIAYHLAIKEELGFDKIVLLDNASDPGLLKQLEHPDVIIHSYKDHIPRTGIWEYPYCWRGLHAAQFLSHFVDKILFIDSDFYILSGKFAKYIKDLNSGWESVFCHQYGFPEAALHILCKDQFKTLQDFPIPSYTHYNNQHMEWLLPFTHVDKTQWVGGRYGEKGLPQTPDMDYYGQMGDNGVTLIFNMEKKQGL